MVLYLHGFASSGRSKKVQAMRDAGLTVHAPDLSHDPGIVEKQVDELVLGIHRSIGAHDRCVFVGTSLGGFYATFFSAQYDSPAIMINPAIRPHLSLVPKLGVNRNLDTGEEFTLTQAHLSKLEEMEKYIQEEMNGCYIHLFGAMDDEVVDIRKTSEYYKYTSTKIITDDGGHRYEKHWDKVIAKVKEIQTGQA